MKDLLDTIDKYVPVQVTLVLLVVAAAFWGVHHWKGFRDYGDTARDRTFLSIAIVAVAALCLYWVNRAPALPLSVQPVVLVPYFDGDERDQYRTALVTQLEQRLAAAGLPRGVYPLPVFLAEYESAVQSGQRYGAKAVVYGAKIVRDKDIVRICFHVALTASNSTKPYAMLPVEIPVAVLDEISNTLLSGASTNAKGTEPANPMVSRLDAIEQQMADLKTDLQRMASRSEPPAAVASYARKYAVVIGVNEIPDSGFSLQYAVADAQAMTDVLKAYGFEVTALTGKEATRPRVMQSISGIGARVGKDDFVVFYYAGNTSADFGRKSSDRLLQLFLADSRVNNPESVLTIKDVRTALEDVQAGQRLVILDGCHGTSGLDGDGRGEGVTTSTTAAAGPLLQFFAASADHEYATESAEAGGGIFTRALIQVLLEAAKQRQTPRMSDVVNRTSALVRTQSSGRQSPKLVTVSGTGEIRWTRD